LALYWFLGLHFIMGGLYFHLDCVQGVLCKRSAVLQPLVVFILIQCYLNKHWVSGTLNIKFHMCNDRGDKPTVRSNRAFPSSETIVAFEISPSSIRSWALTDLFRPCLIVSSNVFQVVFVHLVYNSALFLVSCCFSFLLHVVASK